MIRARAFALLLAAPFACGALGASGTACRATGDTSAASTAPASSDPAASSIAPPASASPSPSASTSSASRIKPLRHRPKNELELPTTPAHAFFASLDAQIASVAKLARADYKSVAPWLMLASLHLVRGKHRGDVDEIGRALDAVNRCILIDAKQAEPYVLRAEVEVTVRRFKASRADLDKAKSLGGDALAIATLEAELDWSEGFYEKAAAAIEEAASARRSPTSLARLAMLHHDMGRADEAERAFEEAEDLVVDTNPMPVATLDAQRGRHLLALGRVDDALLFLREALRRSPDHPAALRDMAEALRLNGKSDDALRLLEDASKRAASDTKDARDPGALGDLAAMERARGQIDQADTHKWRAMWKHQQHAMRFPEIAYAPAAELYLGDANEPPRAVELLRKNLAVASTSEALVLLARAELATGHPESARTSIDRALAMPPRSALLFWTAARTYALVGEDARASELAAKARAMNPIIDRAEPPLVPPGTIAQTR